MEGGECEVTGGVGMGYKLIFDYLTLFLQRRQEGQSIIIYKNGKVYVSLFLIH